MHDVVVDVIPPDEGLAYPSWSRASEAEGPMSPPVSDRLASERQRDQTPTGANPKKASEVVSFPNCPPGNSSESKDQESQSDSQKGDMRPLHGM